MTFRRSCHMPFLKPFLPFTLTANKSTDVIAQPKLSSHWDDRFSDVKYCGRVRHFLDFADDNQVSLHNRHYGGAHCNFWLIVRDTRGEKKTKISLTSRVSSEIPMSSCAGYNQAVQVNLKRKIGVSGKAQMKIADVYRSKTKYKYHMVETTGTVLHKYTNYLHLVCKQSWWMKGISFIWSRGRRFSPSLLSIITT